MGSDSGHSLHSWSFADHLSLWSPAWYCLCVMRASVVCEYVCVHDKTSHYVWELAGCCISLFGRSAWAWVSESGFSLSLSLFCFSTLGGLTQTTPVLSKCSVCCWQSSRCMFVVCIWKQREPEKSLHGIRLRESPGRIIQPNMFELQWSTSHIGPCYITLIMRLWSTLQAFANTCRLLLTWPTKSSNVQQL